MENQITTKISINDLATIEITTKSDTGSHFWEFQTVEGIYDYSAGCEEFLDGNIFYENDVKEFSVSLSNHYIAANTIFNKDAKRLYNDQKIETDIKALLATQKEELGKMNYDTKTIEDVVFGDEDVVDNYLKENDLKSEDVALEDLRDMQHVMVSELEPTTSNEVEKYRFQTGSLYEYDEEKDAYIHVFKNAFCTTKKSAIREYENQCEDEEYEGWWRTPGIPRISNTWERTNKKSIATTSCGCSFTQGEKMKLTNGTIKFSYSYVRGMYDTGENWQLVSSSDMSFSGIKKAVTKWAKEWTGKGSVTIYNIEKLGDCGCLTEKQEQFFENKTISFNNT